jgi:hypothetical protein
MKKFASVPLAFAAQRREGLIDETRADQCKGNTALTLQVSLEAETLLEIRRS